MSVISTVFCLSCLTMNGVWPLCLYALLSNPFYKGMNKQEKLNNNCFINCMYYILPSKQEEMYGKTEISL